VAQVECSLSSARYLFLTHSLSVISENIAINHILPKSGLFGLLFISGSMNSISKGEGKEEGEGGDGRVAPLSEILNTMYIGE